MPRIIWLLSAAILTVCAAGLSIKSTVSETAAGMRHAGVTPSLAELYGKVDMKLMPVTKMDDKSFVFTDPIASADGIAIAGKSGEFGWGPARLTDW